MNRRRAITLLSSFACVAGTARSAPPVDATAATQALERIRKARNLPAMGAVIATSAGVRTTAAAGFRKRGSDVAVAASDLWHIGSLTKAMTSLLAARMVEAGAMRWNSTVGELFAKKAAKWPEPFRRLTLTNLLTHRSGLPANLSPSWNALPAIKDRLEAVRRFAASGTAKPGSPYLYSNAGYVVAGTAMEQLSGKTWETLVAAQVFSPLKMNHAGFGGTGTRGKIDQPWPHNEDGSPLPQNGPASDNPPVLGPAGTVHLPAADYGLFLAEVLRGARGKAGLVKPETWKTMLTPPSGGEYACGWVIADRAWAGGRTLSHNGTNNSNYAVAWIAPEKDIAIGVFCNQGGDAVFSACDEAVKALLGI